GVFDLSTYPVALELPLSPFPSAGGGAVGVVTGTVHVGTVTAPMAFVTNTWFALGTCAMPAGSVTGYDLSLLAQAGFAQPIGNLGVSSSIPYAVGLDPVRG